VCVSVCSHAVMSAEDIKDLACIYQTVTGFVLKCCAFTLVHKVNRRTQFAVIE